MSPQSAWGSAAMQGSLRAASIRHFPARRTDCSSGSRQDMRRSPFNAGRQKRSSGAWLGAAESKLLVGVEADFSMALPATATCTARTLKGTEHKSPTLMRSTCEPTSTTSPVFSCPSRGAIADCGDVPDRRRRCDGALCHASRRFTGPSDRAARIDKTLFIPERTIVDLGMRYRFKLGRTPAVLRAQIANLTNVFGWNVSGGGGFQFMASRRFSVSLSTDF